MVIELLCSLLAACVLSGAHQACHAGRGSNVSRAAKYHCLLGPAKLLGLLRTLLPAHSCKGSRSKVYIVPRSLLYPSVCDSMRAATCVAYSWQCPLVWRTLQRCKQRAPAATTSTAAVCVYSDHSAHCAALQEIRLGSRNEKPRIALDMVYNAVARMFIVSQIDAVALVKPNQLINQLSKGKSRATQRLI